jgi:hypothetical protein
MSHQLAPSVFSGGRIPEIRRLIKKVIIIEDCKFDGCESGIKIKGIKKSVNVEDLNLIIRHNQFDAIKTHSIHVELLNAGRMHIIENTVTKGNSIALRVSNCKAVKEDLQILRNRISAIYSVAIYIDNSIVTLLDNTISSCTSGIYLYLYNNWSKDDMITDSHKDIILRDTNNKDSFIGYSGNNTQFLAKDASLLGVEPVVSCYALTSICRVVVRSNTFKEISAFGVMVQNCSASSLKIEDCRFVNVKEPIVINEKEVNQPSRINTRNLLQGDYSELQLPSLNYATPRSQGFKGTIVIKSNVYEGSDLQVVKKNIFSYLYEKNAPRSASFLK